MKINFSKYDAAGNDFVLIYDPDKEKREWHAIITRRLADRRHGVGADGVIFLERCLEADFRMVYYNADGMGPTMCGNGARSAVHFWCRKNQMPQELHFLASDGLHKARVKYTQGEISSVMVTIKKPDNLQMLMFDDEEMGMLDTGVPHLVVEKENLDQIDVISLGRELRHKYNTNVNFISTDEYTCCVRTYERGVEDETLACGTGATSVAWYLHKVKGRSFPISLEFKGGVLTIDRDHDFLWLEGPVKEVFTGNIDLKI